tara:strand:+ start:5549 stop:5779 length:231 start_codon:yes stop_codon:yes gene_type:complete
MSLKNKAMLFNFLGFAFLFIVLRYFVMDYFAINTLLKAVLSAVIATLFAPKFAVIKLKKDFKLVMKWIFIKGYKEL